MRVDCLVCIIILKLRQKFLVTLAGEQDGVDEVWEVELPVDAADYQLRGAGTRTHSGAAGGSLVEPIVLALFSTSLFGAQGAIRRPVGEQRPITYQFVWLLRPNLA